MARWRYLVPNALTCLGLLIGLAAAYKAIQGSYEESGWLIVLCVLIDKVDGSAARLLGAESEIGLQLDSFADFMNFGIAPATLVFMAMTGTEGIGLWQGGVSVWLLRILLGGYIICAVIRLARFNVVEEVAGAARIFYGMPSTLAGFTIAVVFILGWRYGTVEQLSWLPAFVGALGLLMVSNLPLPKLTRRRWRLLNAFQFLNLALVFVCGLLREWPEYLGAVLLLYATVGFTWGFLHRRELMPQELSAS